MEALVDGPKNAYEIMKALEQRSNGRYTPSPGVVYPTLQLLSEAGMVVADDNGDRKLYTLTDDGRAELASHIDDVNSFWEQFNPRSSAGRAEIGFVAEELEYLGRTVWNALHGRSDEQYIKRVRASIETCRNDIRAIIASAGAQSEE